MSEKKELIEYIDFKGIVKDFDLKSGDLSPFAYEVLETVLKKFVRDNKE